MTARRIVAAAAALLTALAVALVPVVPATASLPGTTNGGVRIMPLGDSITDGGLIVDGGYRNQLWRDLTAAGKTVDFVGYLNSGTPSQFDTDHSGLSGYSSRQIQPYIIRWLYATDPSTILLQLGANDIQQGDLTPTTHLKTLIDTILATKPNVQLFVAASSRIDPTVPNNLAQKMETYNDQIPGILAGRGPNVHFVDMEAELTLADLGDGLHPNAGGFVKMANKWKTVLLNTPAVWSPPTSVQPVDGVVISFTTDNGKNVTAWLNTPGAPVQASVDHVDTWEKFEIDVVGNGFIGLKAKANNRYVTVVSDQLVASSTALGTAQMFRWIDLGNQKFALASALDGDIVGRSGSGDNLLWSNAPHVAGWETFRWSLT